MSGVLVTGSERNFGRAIVPELAGRGTDVIVNARSDKTAADHPMRTSTWQEAHASGGPQFHHAGLLVGVLSALK
ncbi:hypothetical protein [Mycobacterium sp.]|uniref:hypothetical protein n=1 Tax=Mycobacterium sp. TaxID=1785 RepID=UPI003C70A4AB